MGASEVAFSVPWISQQRSYPQPTNHLRTNIYLLTPPSSTSLSPAPPPPGQYLLRIEQFLPTRDLGYSRWYVN